MSNSPKLKEINHTAWCSDDNRAGVVLAQILNETGNSALNRRVCKQASMFTLYASMINTIRHLQVRADLHKNLLQEHKNIISTKNYPDKVADYLYGMMKTEIKEMSRQYLKRGDDGKWQTYNKNV